MNQAKRSIKEVLFNPFGLIALVLFLVFLGFGAWLIIHGIREMPDNFNMAIIDICFGSIIAGTGICGGIFFISSIPSLIRRG